MSRAPTIAAALGRAALRALSLAALVAPARAQTDFVGDWDQAGGGIFGFLEEFLDRGGGPDLGREHALERVRPS